MTINTQSDVIEHADALHRQAIVAVMHDHNPIIGDLPKMRAGDVTAKVLNLSVDVEVGKNFEESRGRLDGWAKRLLIAFDEVTQAIEAHQDEVGVALTAGDIERAKQERKIAVLFGCEGGKPLEGEIGLLRMFYRLGLRELQLAWATPNHLLEGDGLSEFGRRVVQEMNRLGMIVDLTHLPRQAFDEVCALSERPVIVSHGSARGVTTDLDDGQIEAVAKTGGMIGVHFYSTYLSRDQRVPTVDDLLDQIDYISCLVGVDHVGLGCDFFPTEGVWGDFQRAQGTRYIAWALDDLSGMPEVTRGLVRRGYRDEDIEKVLGRNFLRVCREVLRG